MKMGTFVGVTASNGARIREGKEEEVLMLIEKYNFQTEDGPHPFIGGLVCRIENGSIEIWGYEWPEWTVGPKNDEDNDGCTNYFLEFLEKLAPFLAEALVIHSIGNEKCVFPLAAVEIKVTRRGVVRRGRFKWMC
jgi:hypothetical protein